MFDLDKAISDWRRQMLIAGIKTPVPLDELENHLRDDIEQQLRLGTGAQQAYETAVVRIGQADAVQAEFKKTAGSIENKSRKLRLIFGYLNAVGILAFGIWSFAFPNVLGKGLKMNVTERTLAISTIVLWASIIGSIQLWHHFLPVIRNKPIRATVGILYEVFCVLWMCVFAFCILPRLEFAEPQRLIAILWSWTPCVASGPFRFGLEEAVRHKIATTGS